MPDFDFNTKAGEVIEKWGFSIKGKTVVITGASDGGLGGATALSIAHGQPFQMILLARSEKKVQNVAASIERISPSTKACFVSIELGDFDSVRKAASDISRKIPVGEIDLLINNAGVMAIPWEKNKSGIEQTLAINHLGHFLLTKLLMPYMIAAAPGSRVVNLSSAGYEMGPFRFDDWNFSDGKTYNEYSSYAQSKTANILFTIALAERCKRHGILAFVVHPGFIPETSLTTHVANMDPKDMDTVSRENTGFAFSPDEPKSLEQGIATTLVAALSPDLTGQSGTYLGDCQVREVRGYAQDPVLANKLWKLSEDLVGEVFDI